MLAVILYSILCWNRNFISVKGAKLLRGNPRPTYAGTVTGSLIYQQAHTTFLSICCYMPAQPSDVHAKSYLHRGQEPSPIMALAAVQWGGKAGGGGGGLGCWGCWPHPLLFRFCLQWKAFDLLYKMKYILCIAGGLWRRHQKWSPSCIFSRTRNQVKTVKINNFLRLTSKTTYK